jgi:hypothetical protein
MKENVFMLGMLRQVHNPPLSPLILRGDVERKSPYLKAGCRMKETLSQELINALPPDGAYGEKHRISNSEVSLAIKKASPKH